MLKWAQTHRPSVLCGEEDVEKRKEEERKRGNGSEVDRSIRSCTYVHVNEVGWEGEAGGWVRFRDFRWVRLWGGFRGIRVLGGKEI